MSSTYRPGDRREINVYDGKGGDQWIAATFVDYGDDDRTGYTEWKLDQPTWQGATAISISCWPTDRIRPVTLTTEQHLENLTLQRGAIRGIAAASQLVHLLLMRDDVRVASPEWTILAELQGRIGQLSSERIATTDIGQTAEELKETVS